MKWAIEEENEIAYLIKDGKIIRTVFISEEDEGYYYKGLFFTDFNKIKQRIQIELGEG